MNSHTEVPLISVIIPCYNAVQYVQECIESVLNQTYQNIEVICVNDHSTDHTLKVLEEIAAGSSKVQVFTNSGKGGNAARNYGLSKAKGDFIQFLDADDILLPEKLEKQVSLATDGVDLVLCNYEIRALERGEVLRRAVFEDSYENFLECAITRIIITNNPIYRASFLKRTGGYKEGLKSAQDWEFHIRLALHNPVVKHVNESLFYNRAVEGSVSSNWKEVALMQCEVVNSLDKNLLASKKLTQQCKDHIAQLFYNAVVHNFSNLKAIPPDLYKGLLEWLKLGRLNHSIGKRVFAILFGTKALIKFEMKRFQ